MEAFEGIGLILSIDSVAHLILAQLYSTQTFSYVGPPTDIIKSYVVRSLFQMSICAYISLMLQDLS